MWTRGGQPVAAPGWFTAGFPAQPLCVKLWARHRSFERTVSITRQRIPSDAGWRDIRFMVFDLPAQGGHFGERAAVLPQLVSAVAQPWLVGVRQQLVKDHASLQALMHKTVRDGGEGLMLHRLDSLYCAGRSRDLLKYKPDDDADARVLAHLAGQGKFKGLLGALLVETPESVRVKLGTGFDDALRRDPPAIGSWISYRFRGETRAGIPRFASLLRVRADLP